jgi:hypothetical protein
MIARRSSCFLAGSAQSVMGEQQESTLIELEGLINPGLGG